MQNLTNQDMIQFNLITLDNQVFSCIRNFQQVQEFQNKVNLNSVIFVKIETQHKIQMNLDVNIQNIQLFFKKFLNQALDEQDTDKNQIYLFYQFFFKGKFYRLNLDDDILNTPSKQIWNNNHYLLQSSFPDLFDIQVQILSCSPSNLHQKQFQQQSTAETQDQFLHHNNSISKFEFDVFNTPCSDKDEPVKNIVTQEFNISQKNNHEYNTYDHKYHHDKLQNFLNLFKKPSTPNNLNRLKKSLAFQYFLPQQNQFQSSRTHVKTISPDKKFVQKRSQSTMKIITEFNQNDHNNSQKKNQDKQFYSDQKLNKHSQIFHNQYQNIKTQNIIKILKNDNANLIRNSKNLVNGYKMLIDFKQNHDFQNQIDEIYKLETQIQKSKEIQKSLEISYHECYQFKQNEALIYLPLIEQINQTIKQSRLQDNQKQNIQYNLQLLKDYFEFTQKCMQQNEETIEIQLQEFDFREQFITQVIINYDFGMVELFYQFTSTVSHDQHKYYRLQPYYHYFIEQIQISKCSKVIDDNQNLMMQLQEQKNTYEIKDKQGLNSLLQLERDENINLKQKCNQIQIEINNQKIEIDELQMRLSECKNKLDQKNNQLLLMQQKQSDQNQFCQTENSITRYDQNNRQLNQDLVLTQLKIQINQKDHKQKFKQSLNALNNSKQISMINKQIMQNLQRKNVKQVLINQIMKQYIYFNDSIEEQHNLLQDYYIQYKNNNSQTQIDQLLFQIQDQIKEQLDFLQTQNELLFINQ